MNKKTAKRLKIIAMALPVAMEQVFELVLGQKLIDQGTQKTADGKLINPDLIYKALQPKVIDHVAKVKMNYLKYGMAGVEEYCQYIRSVAGDKITGINQHSEWFNTDNLHELGGGRVHYTQDGKEAVINIKELENCINTYLATGEADAYKFEFMTVDAAVNVRLYGLIQKKVKI